MKYYRLTEDMTSLNKWYISEINDLLYTRQWGFTTQSLFFIDEDLVANIKTYGLKTDFTENLTYDVPMLSLKAKNVFKDYEVVFSKVEIVGDEEEYVHYYAMGVDIVEAVNEAKSIYIKYEKDDPVRPDKEGDYKSFAKMVLNRSKIHDKHIFRVKGYNTYLVVSEELKAKIESENLIGFSFEEINVF